MAKFSRIDVVTQIKNDGLVPLFYNPDVELCKKILQACYNGGVRVFEFTNRGDFAHEVFAELIKYAAKEMPGLIMGVGSVIDHGTASLYMQSGANFIVSPLLNAEMAKVCNRRKVAWVPGCGTVSEINFAEELGAEIVKIFPAGQVGGPAFVKSVTAPCPWTSIMASGGVSPDKENLQAWFDAGVFCVGMGSKLFPKNIIKEGKFEEITENVKNSLALIKQIKESK